MKKVKIFFALALASLAAVMNSAAQDSVTNVPAWLTRPLSLADAMNTALEQNATILEAQNDLAASHGVVVQTRAVALPHLQATSQYKYTNPSDIEPISAEVGPGENFSLTTPDQNWNADIQIVQDIYMGGRLMAAFRAADAT